MFHMSLEAISQWGLLIVWALAVFIVAKYFLQRIKKEDSENVRDPLQHKFFSEIDFYITNKIPNIKLYTKQMEFDEGRTKIFRDMLMVKVKARKKNVMYFVTKTDENLLDVSTSCINDLINEYTKIRWDMAIPQIVIDKFNYWHSPHASALMQAIEGVCGSRSFHNDREKKNAILHLHTMMLVFTLLDAEKTLWVLNGELTGMVYKWLTIR